MENLIENLLKENRVSVILGSNGSGKSRLLKTYIASHANTCLYIEGGRSVNLPGKLGNIFEMEQFERLKKDVETKRDGNLSSRLNNELAILYKSSNDIESNWVKELKANGKNSSKPEDAPITSADKLFSMFSDIFQDISLGFDLEESQFLVTSGDSTYPINDLSDGEKQSLAVLVDLLNRAEVPEVILVDEPELNLHPMLAVKLWETIEVNMPDSRFVYASHNVLFAARTEVETIAVLSRNEDPLLLTREALHQIPNLQDLLGSVAGILAFNRVLLCEGSRSSKFDETFYRWVLGDSSVGIFPVSNCNSVMSAVRSSEALSDLVGNNHTIVGVIDRDGREKNYENIHRLEYDEAESYLCHPQVLSSVLDIDIKTACEIVAGAVQNIFAAHGVRINAAHIAHRSRSEISISISSEKIDSLEGQDHLIQEAISARDGRIEYVQTLLSDAFIGGVVDEARKYITELEAKNYEIDVLEGCLRFIPGKQLCGEILRSTKFKSKFELLDRTVILDPNSIPPIERLSSSLNSLLCIA